MKLIKWLKLKFTPHPYIYVVPGGMFLWRVHKKTLSIELSGNIPDNWTPDRQCCDVSHILSYRRLTLEQAKKKFPNANF